MKRLSIAILLQFTLLGAPTRAVAAPSTPGTTAEASAHFNRGVELYREGNLDAALAEFLRAQEIAPNYRLLYNMAQVQSERHDYARAIELLEEYLRQGGADIAAQRRTQVEEELTRLRARVGVLWVSADVQQGTLWLNDQRAAVLPLETPVLVNPGLVRVRVEAEGRKPYQGELNVAGGDRPRLELALEVATTAPIVMAAPTEPQIDYTPVWISGITAAGLGVGAVTFGILTSGADDDLSQELDTFPGDARKIEDARSKVRTFAGLTDGFTAAAVIAAGVGIYYLAFPSHESKVDEQPMEPGSDLRVSAGLGNISVEGTF